MNLVGIEIVEDRTADSRCDEGFLTLRRLTVRHQYSNGTTSEPFPCDVVKRPGSDAVVCVLFEIRNGRVIVALREAPRVPIYLRKHDNYVHPDDSEYLTILEVVAGMVEPEDTPGKMGLFERARIEAREEAGLEPEGADLLGGETFASPGTGDEKLYFVGCQAPLAEAKPAEGDGSIMEEWSQLHEFDLVEAIRDCRRGRIPDMKTEVALFRLADAIGYLPQLGCFARDLDLDIEADDLGVHD